MLEREEGREQGREIGREGEARRKGHEFVKKLLPTQFSISKIAYLANVAEDFDLGVNNNLGK